MKLMRYPAEFCSLIRIVNMTDVKASMDTQDTQSLGGFMCLSDYEETNHHLEIHKTQWEVRGSMLALHDLDKISFTSINSQLEKYVVIRVDILELVMVNIPCKGGGVQQCFHENNKITKTSSPPGTLQP